MLKTTIVDYVSVGGYVVYGDTFYPMALAHWHPTEEGIVMYALIICVVSDYFTGVTDNSFQL
mgnify:CR=1 FL=1